MYYEYEKTDYLKDLDPDTLMLWGNFKALKASGKIPKAITVPDKDLEQIKKINPTYYEYIKYGKKLFPDNSN